MKEENVVRKVDTLGRVAIPMAIRRAFGIDQRDPLTIFSDGDRIVLAKPSESCVVCGATDGEQIVFKDQQLCSNCIAELIKK